MPAPRRQSLLRRAMEAAGGRRKASGRKTWLVRRPARKWRWATAGVAVVVASALVGQNLLRPTPAWTALPAMVSAEETLQLRRQCESFLGVGHSSVNFRPTELALAEKRGTRRSTLIVGLDNQVAICIGQSDRERSVELGSEFGGFFKLSSRTERLSLDSSDSYDSLRVVFGRAEQHFARIVIDTADNRAVTATVVGGYFLAWWPSDAEATKVHAYDAEGELVHSVKI